MKRLRCAIYTRKSSEEGLDQAFNSLHAQREACEAYVLSQAGEGWVALPEIYDDGGFSGGNMERPGLKALLAAIQAKRIDVVVVYKVDRLTRSLGDFARIVEQFDGSGVSFVSVTQAFNTTTSMGRLTLNVLLSFAQFEREVTGERIRDKIAASKAKGMWMGGTIPHGYDLPTDATTRALVVNPAEAEMVRSIFARYLEVGSVHTLAKILTAEGVLTKIVVNRAGVSRGGNPFKRGPLYYLLRNRTYLGEIPHKDRFYPGAHPPILDVELFQAVQARLDQQGLEQRKRRQPSPTRSPLKGLLFDVDGDRMSPVAATNRHGKKYRYYVSSAVQRGLKPADENVDAVRRIGAEALESLIAERLGRLCPGVSTFPDGLVARLDAMPTSIVVSLKSEMLAGYASDPDGAIANVIGRRARDERVWVDGADATLKLAIAVRPQLTGGRTEFVADDGKAGRLGARRDVVLITALKRAHRGLAMLRAGSEGAMDTKRKRSELRLALLAPDLQRAILDGRQPAGLNLTALIESDLPACWHRQRELFESLSQQTETLPGLGSQLSRISVEASQLICIS